MWQLEDRIYVTGGNDDATCLNSAECYNSELNTWECLPSMSVRRQYGQEQSKKRILGFEPISANALVQIECA